MLILYAQGSSESRWLDPFHTLEAQAQKLAAKEQIALAFMAYALPTLEETIKDGYSKGVRSFNILPLFVATGPHLALDLPEQMAELQKSCPGCSIKVLPPLLEIAPIREAILALARDNL